MDNIERRANESEIEHHKRLVYGKLVDKTLSDVDYTELSMEVYNKEYSSDVARRMMYGSRDTLQLIDNCKIEGIEDMEIIDEMEEKKLELKRERVRVQTEKLEYNRWIRENVRSEMFIDKIVDAINSLEKIHTPILTTFNNGKSNIKEGILAIADIHFGREGVVYGIDGKTILNEYNEDVFERRMWELLDEAIHIIEKEQLEVVNLFILGDVIDGLLRVSQIKSLQYGIVDSTIKVSEFLVKWIAKLSKHTYVNVYSNTDNHSEIRPLGTNAGDMPHEQMSKIICFYMQSRLKDNANVCVNDIKEINYVDILGVKVATVHGHNDRKIENSIKDYVHLYGKRIDLLLSAHYHSGASQTVGANEFGNIEVIRTPSICSTDDYAVKLKKSAKAGSKFMIIEEGKGKTITYDITLD